MKTEFFNLEEEVNYFCGMIKSAGEYTKKMFDDEARRYVDMYKNKFSAASGMDPLSESNRIDVNVVYPIVKSLIPNLYFRDPKVFVRPQEDEITIPVLEQDEMGNMQEVIDPETGMPMFRTFNASDSAHKFEGRLNINIKAANLKYETKSAILDAHLMFYGAIKCGWGNDQGVASMGEGAPPSMDEDVHENMAYAVRLKPWDVIVDPTDFYKPKWIPIRYCVEPEQLKADTRLQNTEGLTGKTSLDDKNKSEKYKYLKPDDMKYVEYYELYIKPCAAYPQGRFMMLTEEMKTAFMFDGAWPYAKARTFPVKLLYFNPDPNGDFPIPDVRYYAMQQKAKVNLRNTAYEHVQRSLPMIVVSTAGLKNDQTLKNQLTSNQIPRVITTQQPRADNVIGSYTPPALGNDFYNLDALIDNDVSRMTGMISPVSPSTEGQDQLASALKLAASGESIRQNERADIVTDFISDIITFWACLYQEFLTPGGFTMVEGDKIPIPLHPEEIQGKFSYEIKPFSMSYEDPAILRKQYVDLLNLLSSPEARLALAEQGVRVNLAHILKRILETYQERDVENFIQDDAAEPEAQIVDALNENNQLMGPEAIMVKVEDTDADKIHILIHQMIGPAASEHILQHQANMMKKAGMSTPGGGNPEGNPVNGVASNQDLMGQSASPSPTNQSTAINREAGAY